MSKVWKLKTGIAGIAALGLAALSTTMLSTAARAAEYTLNLVFLANQDDEDYDGAMVFKDYVEARSNGAIEVTIYPGGQLCGNAVECSEALSANLIQIFITTTGGISNVFPEIQVLDLPYMLSSDRVAECTLKGPLLDKIRRAVLEKTGSLRLMVAGNTGGWRNFATTNKLIKSPQDVKGLKLRTISSPIQQELVRAMGGNPTPIPWPEVYTSLATGVVEGTKNGITDIIGMKFEEHLKYITLDGHAYMASFWWMNDQAYGQLPDDLKKVVIDGFDALATTTIVFPKRRQIDAYKAFTAAGGTIYAPNAEEKAAFKAAAQPVYDWYVDKFGAEWLDATNAAVAACEASINDSYKAQM